MTCEHATLRFATPVAREMARALGVTPDNLRGAIARDALKAAKHGRDWWVEPREVERYRKEHRRTNAFR